jgi:SPP1 family predicted phage head-tail adaptor
MPTHFVDPGALKSELSLQAANLTPDGMGGHVEIWVETAVVFGLVEPLTQSSVYGADQTLETLTHRVTLRHRDGVESGMRFVTGGRVLDIVTVHDPDETGRYLVCRARETGA